MRETRAVALTGAEVRTADDSPALTFTGHAAVFNQRTWIGPKDWGFWEEVDPRFFDDVLADDARFLVNHDPNIVLARNGSTMSLAVDERGLVVTADWDPADPDAVKWAGRVKRGDVTQMSFAFTIAEEKWSEAEDGKELRTLLKAKNLYDSSLVTYPAYDGTDAAMREARAVADRHRAEVRTGQPPTIEDGLDSIAGAPVGDADLPTVDAVPVADHGDGKRRTLAHLGAVLHKHP